MGGIPEVLNLPAESEPARLIALRLHALHEEDREWILGQLDPEPRGVLSGLLAELRQLGFSPLPELRLGDRNVLPPQTSSGGESASIRRIDAAAAGAVWQALRDEPEAIRRCVLAAHDWPWLDDLRQLQPLVEASGHRIEPGREPTVRARQSLLKALAGRLATDSVAVDGSPAASRDPTPVAGLRRGVGKALTWRR